MGKIFSYDKKIPVHLTNTSNVYFMTSSVLLDGAIEEMENNLTEWLRCNGLPVTDEEIIIRESVYVAIARNNRRIQIDLSSYNAGYNYRVIVNLNQKQIKELFTDEEDKKEK